MPTYLGTIEMPLWTGVYVTRASGAYRAKIGFLSNPPVILGCTLAPEHEIAVTKDGRTLNPDYETAEVLEHLVLLGARRIRTETFDVLKEQQCGNKICVDCECELDIIYGQRQIPGEIETTLMRVPRYLEDLIKSEKK